MRVEVVLSVMNLKTKDLDKMNITSKCTVINQCGKNGYKKYNNFNIYSYDEKGAANSRNRGFERIKEDIILLCDDDVIYNKNYEKLVLNEFKNNPKADMIIFNLDNPYRKKRIIKKKKRLHIYNSLNYASYNIAFRKRSLGSIRMNPLFGAGGYYSSGGDDTLFIVDFLRKGLKIYGSDLFLGKVEEKGSTWFKGYNKKYFFDKGALFSAISYRFRKILFLQFLIRHKDLLNELKFKEAYKEMKRGSIDYKKIRRK